MKFKVNIVESIQFISNCVLNFFIKGISFRGLTGRKEYFTGFIATHLLLLLILPLLINDGNLQSFRSLLSLFLMGITFFISLSATCRRVHDAGGYWFGPIIPLAVYLSFCCIAFIFNEIITQTVFLIFLGIFFTLLLYNMYYVFKRSANVNGNSFS